MAYSELVKDFSRIRAYMREFYVYGFRGREEIGEKSARSYDNERRRVESWLGDYMRFRRDENGKQIFLSMDSRALFHNPLYKAFRAKSFTDMDIILHFVLLDLLRDEEMTVREATDRICTEYLSQLDEAELPDESTVRKKLKEYEKLGLVILRRRGREILYTAASDTVKLSAWQDAIAFFSEDAPLGVIGSYFDKSAESAFGYKHRYLLGALDSEIMLALLECMEDRRDAELMVFSRRKKSELVHIICPLQFYCSTQTGRQYILGFHKRFGRLMFFRLDAIRKVKSLDADENAEGYKAMLPDFRKKLWGVSTGRNHPTEHICMDIRVREDEFFIIDRLKREKRCGTVTRIDARTWRFEAEVYDADELLPWVRTFIGRIQCLECSNPAMEERFYDDLKEMAALYGGDADAVQ